MYKNMEIQVAPQQGYLHLDEPTDDEVIYTILAVPVHMAFTPRSAKQAGVTYNAVVVTAKKWTVTPSIASEADVTNFESLAAQLAATAQITGPDGTAIVTEVKLACVGKVEFSIELDADAAANLYDAGIRAGNSSLALKLYMSKVSFNSVFWSIPNPFFKSVPMVGDVKATLSHTISGEGSAGFIYPTGNF